MPILSMTGFGAAAVEEGGLSIRVEARSVNHRFLQVKVRLPGELSQLETDVEAAVRRKAKRGAFTVAVHAGRKAEAVTVLIDERVAAAYAKQLKALSSKLSLGGEPELEHLLGLPGVVQPVQDEPALADEGKRVLRTVALALTELTNMRATEGEALARDLEKNGGALRKLVLKIEERMPKVVKQHHANLKRRVEELLEGRQSVSESDLAREVAVLADKLDVSEEVSRLASHLDQLEKLLAGGGAIGRQLDFLVQELLREINTIGSKCNDATVAHWVVEAKTRIERMREQVQNVE